MIQNRTAGLVHHMLLYGCSNDFDPKHLNVTGECYGSMPKSLSDCAGRSAIHGWAIGGTVRIFSFGLIKLVHEKQKYHISEKYVRKRTKMKPKARFYFCEFSRTIAHDCFFLFAARSHTHLLKHAHLASLSTSQPTVVLVAKT